MGRKLKRKTDQYNAKQNKKNQITISRNQLADSKQKYAEAYNKDTIEQLMVCVALAERRLYNFGETRLLRTLHYIDDLMGDIYDDKYTKEDYARMLKDECGMEIRFNK